MKDCPPKGGLYDGRRHLRGKVFLEPVAWDNPGAGLVMEATISPQEAIDRGLPKPADCDIVVVIFWMRMGTQLPNPPYRKANGEPYYSGAEWEYENAIEPASPNKGAGDPSGRAGPEVVVYRRKARTLPDPDAPDFKEKVEQYERVKNFFAQFRDPKTGANLRGWYGYKRPEDFRRKFADDLRIRVGELLKAPAPACTLSSSPPPRLWPGSPFPGLRAFTDKDAPIFFGRGRETDQLMRLWEEIQNPDTPHIRRSQIGERLATIGDARPGVGLRPDGLPDIAWCKVEFQGKSSVDVQIKYIGKFKVDLPFYIARYPVTYRQFQAFMSAGRVS